MVGVSARYVTADFSWTLQKVTTRRIGRETFLVKVDWEDDWPIFNSGHNITTLTEGRRGKQLAPDSSWNANLNQETLELGWYYKRKFLLALLVTRRYDLITAIPDTPLKREWSLTARPGHLRLYGGCYDLSSPESPTMLLRKQTDFYQTFQATLDFQPSRVGYEAGIAVWYSMYSYASIGIGIASHETGAEGRAVVVKLPTSDVGIARVSPKIGSRTRYLLC
jgi:beta-xylosidase